MQEVELPHFLNENVTEESIVASEKVLPGQIDPMTAKGTQMNPVLFQVAFLGLLGVFSTGFIVVCAV